MDQRRHRRLIDPRWLDKADRRRRPTAEQAAVAAGLAAEVARLKQLLARSERHIREAFSRFVATVKSEPVMAEVRQLLERGDIEGALQIVDQHVRVMAVSVSNTFLQTAMAESRVLADAINAMRPAVAISFEPGYPRAAQLMQENTLRFVREVTDAQRVAIRSALVDAMNAGLSPVQAPRAFRDAIGLTQSQQAAVSSYQRALESQASNALDRALRDRRFDRTVERAIRSDTVLSADQVDRMVGRYRDRMVAARGETIARTEGVRTMSTARNESVRQVMEQAQIPDERLQRTWKSLHDNRVRETHMLLDGQSVIGIDTPFQSVSGALLMYPGDPEGPPEEVINCRCSVIHEILPPV